MSPDPSGPLAASWPRPLLPAAAGAMMNRWGVNRRAVCARRPQVAEQVSNMRMLIAVAALSLATAPAARSAADTPAQGPADDVLPMSALFVPSTHLPSRCDLRTHGVGADGRLRISGALPAGSNPWAGSDPEMLGLIRARILGPPRMPDGPPPGTAQARAMVTRSADGVEEGYVATYYAEQENAFIAVHAIRFADPRDVDPPQAARGTFAIGRTLVSVSGPQGACFEAIEEYLRGLGR